MRHLRSLEYGTVRLGSQDIVHAFTVQISQLIMRALLGHLKTLREFPLTTCLHSLLKPLRRLHFLVARILQNPVIWEQCNQLNTSGARQLETIRGMQLSSRARQPRHTYWSNAARTKVMCCVVHINDMFLLHQCKDNSQ